MYFFLKMLFFLISFSLSVRFNIIQLVILFILLQGINLGKCLGVESNSFCICFDLCICMYFYVVMYLNTFFSRYYTMLLWDYILIIVSMAYQAKTRKSSVCVTW